MQITEKDGAVTISIRVQPRSSRTEIVGEVEGAIRIRLAAPPVDGEANEELVRFLAKLFGVARQQVTILSGATAKNKIVRINGVSQAQAVKALTTTPQR